MTRWHHDEDYRQRHRKYKQTWHKKNKAKINKLLKEFKKNGCTNCGEDHPATLVAHHLNPSEKEHTISKMANFSWQRVEAELKKTVCLCCNCHAKLHAGEKIKTS